MLFIRSFARSATALCLAWPLLFLQIQPAVAVSQKSDGGALPLLGIAENEPLVLPGVVINEVPEDSALIRAGLQPGDVIVDWERLPNPPVNREGASGVIENPFDWIWLEVEQAPRGEVRLQGMRRGSPMSWLVGNGVWEGIPSPVRGMTAFGGRQERANFGLGASLSLEIQPVSIAVGEWSLLSSAKECRAEECRTLSENHLSRLATSGSSHRVRVVAWRELSGLYESWGQTELAREALRRLMHEEGVGTVLSAYSRGAEFQINDSTDPVAALCGRARIDAQVARLGSLPLKDDTFATVAALNRIGVLSLRLGAPADSCTALVAALDIVKVHDSAGLQHASVLNNLGVLAGSVGNWKLSGYFQEKAYDLRKNANASIKLLATSLNNLGQLALKRREPSIAIGYLSQAMQLLRSSEPSSLLTTVVKENLALSLSDAGELDRAASLQAEVMDGRKGMSQDSPYYSAAIFNAGNIALKRGNLGDAEKYFKKSLDIKKMFLDADDSLVPEFTNLGVVLMYRGQLYEAETYLLAALRTLSRGGVQREGMEEVLNDLGVVANLRGDHEMAKAFYEQSLKVQLDAGVSGLGMVEALNNTANSEADLGNLAAARRLYMEGIRVEKSSSPRGRLLPELYTNLGILDMEAGKAQAARKHLVVAGRVMLSRGIFGQKYALLVKTIADLDLSLGRYLEAKKGYEKTLDIMDRLPATAFFLTNALQRLAEISERNGDASATTLAWDRAIDSLESQTLQIDTVEAIRSSARGGNSGVFRGAIRSAIAEKNEERAFSILERFKAHGLLQLLGQRAVMRQNDQEGLSTDALRMYAAISEGQSPRDARRMHAGQVEGAVAVPGGPTQEKASAPTTGVSADELSLRQLSSSLDRGTTLLAFTMGDRNSYLFILNCEDNLRLIPIPASEKELRQRVERFRELIFEARSGSALGDLKLAELRGLGKDLYNLLLAPAADRIEKSERVMIVADGPLYYLPFAALTREVLSKDGVTRDQYLAEWKPFHSVLSATVFAELKKGRRDPSRPDQGTAKQFVAFGDPFLPNSITSEPDGIADIRVRSAIRRGTLEVGPLPYTRREVEGIAALFPPDRVRAFLGAEATEENAKLIGKGARILHFATHARLDDRFPLNTSLLLSMPEGFPEVRENGLLQVWEIFEQVRLDADLVVLSACDSGLGEEQGGEGLIGLTRAFQYAGARTVVASLWAVRDEATAELMIRFYRHLTAGEPKDQALQAAQRELLGGPIEIPGADGKPIRFDATAPYYWAAFQVIGDWQ